MLLVFYHVNLDSKLKVILGKPKVIQYVTAKNSSRR